MNGYKEFVKHYEGYWKKKYDEAIEDFIEDITKEIRSYKRDLFLLRKKWKKRQQE